MERREEEWVREGDERNIILSSLSVPVDVIVQSGDMSRMLSLTVKERRESG